ncbi:MAG TPA: hypothetical protein VFI39_00110 [Gemmatimonadales bacterium]|nr:hypothetical protein [Gemmatimonadales bacterium]
MDDRGIHAVRDLVPLVQVGRALGLTYQQAYGRVLAGSIPAERVDGRWYVPMDALKKLAGGIAGPEGKQA